MTPEEILEKFALRIFGMASTYTDLKQILLEFFHEYRNELEKESETGDVFDCYGSD